MYFDILYLLYLAESHVKRLTALKQEKEINWKWQSNGSIIYGTSGSFGSQKIAAFDMDETLITTKSGQDTPINADDWVFFYKEVPDKLRQLVTQGFKIVVFTNQKAISIGKTNPQHIKSKIEQISRAANIHMAALIACRDDYFRKPNARMWQFQESHLNNGIKVQKALSFFCGDAAGRSSHHYQDFSDADMKFAINIGVKFILPEVLFLGHQQPALKIKGLNPKQIPHHEELIRGTLSKQISLEHPEIVVYVGSPASGKSTFWQNYMHQYIRIDPRSYKNPQKCFEGVNQALKSKNSVVIDDSNGTRHERKIWISLSHKNDLKCRCFYFLTPKQICFHNNQQRSINDKRIHLSEKAQVKQINKWFKLIEQPQISEGFSEIQYVNFIPKFTNQDDEMLYYSFNKNDLQKHYL